MIGPGTADAIRCLVEKEFGPGYWEGFQAYMTEDDGHQKEWRFGGQLGFGGKVHFNGLRCWVSAYPNDQKNAEEDILRVNRELEDLVQVDR